MELSPFLKQLSTGDKSNWKGTHTFENTACFDTWTPLPSELTIMVIHPSANRITQYHIKA